MKIYWILLLLLIVILLCLIYTNKEHFCVNSCNAYSCGVRGTLATATFNDLMSHPQLLYPPNPMPQII
jgi:hypothetical protein